jgi:hypothetical protein
MSTASAKVSDPQVAAAEMPPMTAFEQVAEWFREEGAWWLGSLVVHMFGLCVLAMITVKVMPQVLGEAPFLSEVNLEDETEPAEPVEKAGDFELGTTPVDPNGLDLDLQNLDSQASASAVEFEPNPTGRLDGTEDGPPGGGVKSSGNQLKLGGTDGFNIIGTGSGPALRGKGHLSGGDGYGKYFGEGGNGPGDFGVRDPRYRPPGLRVPKAVDRAVVASLFWLVHHQNADGSWTQDGYRRRCTDASCTGPGGARQDVGTTALGVLPLLGTGITHKVKVDPRRQKPPTKEEEQMRLAVQKGLAWLISKQDRYTGDLRGSGGTMYAHGLATIALCEAYGMTKAYGMAGDPWVGIPAQRAVNFIQSAQHSNSGGWRYAPGDEGDLSVAGWQVMALTSAKIAGLQVNPAALEKARKYVESMACGYHGEQFRYQANREPNDAMTSVGLLCSQYLGAKRNEPRMTEGANYLISHAPQVQQHRNVYYWYYAAQVMHNLGGRQWDDWNRTMRRVLIDTQVKEGCAAGSWDPTAPSPDQWGAQGGRLVITSLSALTLEVYYRYLPLYKLDAEDGGKPAAPPTP